MRLLFTLLIIIMLTGCASKKIELIAQYVDKPELTLPQSDVLTLKKIKWTLVTEDNIDQAFEELKETGRPLVFFSTTDEGYENLATNLSSIRAYIQQQQAKVDAYERYYFRSESTFDSANREIEQINEEIEEVNEEADESWYDKMKKKFSDQTDELIN